MMTALQQKGMQQQGQMGGGQQGALFTPYDSGMQDAIASARQSLGLSQDQKDAALRKSMLAFGQSIGSQAPVKGFWKNFGQAAKALNPAMTSYAADEDAGLVQNNAIANQMMDRGVQEDARAFRDSESLWDRDYKDRALAETKRAHNLMHEFRKSKDQGGFIELDGKQYRKLDQRGITKAKLLKEKTGTALHAINNVNKQLPELIKHTEDNVFASVGGLSAYANPVKDKFGRVFGVKSLEDDTAERKGLEALLGQLTVDLEQTKIGGKLAQGMYDRLKPFYPTVNSKDTEGDSIQTLKTKLASLTKHAQENYAAAQLAHQYGVDLDQYDLQELLTENSGQQPTNEMGGVNTERPPSRFIPNE
ncbi:MAG: hypothetical protein V4440_06370 [Pseudomonadota bacterium]